VPGVHALRLSTIDSNSGTFMRCSCALGRIFMFVPHGHGTDWCPAGAAGTDAMVSIPKMAGMNPTGTMGALAYGVSDGLVNKYVKDPGQSIEWRYWEGNV
jgi:hypothetical protein